MSDQQQPEPVKPPAGDESEPETTGTVFLMVLFLMGTVALWLIMYFRLLER